MTGTDDEFPFGRGFVAACIVIGAILLCGIVLAVTGLRGDPATSLPAPAEAPSPSASPSHPTGPARTPDGCRLPDGDQGIPLTPPPTDQWEVNRRVVVPRSAQYGPAEADADGFRRCFAHSPTGGVFAAYHAVAAMADQRRTVQTAGKLMLPGPGTDALLRELRREKASADSDPAQLAGYRVVDAGRDRLTVALAMPVESAYVSATLTLVWYGGDWRVVPPRPGEPVGAPYGQHRNLAGFVGWSGV